MENIGHRNVTMYPSRDKRTPPSVIQTFCNNNSSRDTPLVRPACFGCQLVIAMSIEGKRYNRKCHSPYIPQNSMNASNNRLAYFCLAYKRPSAICYSKPCCVPCVGQRAFQNNIVSNWRKKNRFSISSPAKKRTLFQLAIDSRRSLLMLINV